MPEYKYELSEEGIEKMLSEHEDESGYNSLLDAVEQFRNDMIAEAKTAVEWEEESGMVDDGYYDLCEPFEGEMTLDAAISHLDAPGWGFSTEALRIIEDFDVNVGWALEECDPDYKYDPGNRVFDIGQTF